MADEEQQIEAPADDGENYDAPPADDPPPADYNEEQPPADTADAPKETNEKKDDGVQMAMQKETKPAHLYDADDDGIPDEEMFEGSTHGFAIFFAEKRDVSRLIIAYFVFAMQMTLYIVCMNQVIDDLSGNEFTIDVSVRFGKKCTDANNLVCPPDLPNLGYVALASVLLSFFLMHDLLASFRIFATVPGGWAKLAGFIILFEALFAALIGAMFAIQAGSGYDAIANCVGVLFIHDADEKAYEAFMILNAQAVKDGCCAKCCALGCCKYVRLAAIFIATFIIMVFALILGVSFRAVQKSQIIDIYGDSYWDARFSSGSYTYSWSDDWSSDLDWDSWGYSPTSSSGGSPTSLSGGGGGSTPSPAVGGGGGGGSTPSPAIGGGGGGGLPTPFPTP